MSIKNLGGGPWAFYGPEPNAVVSGSMAFNAVDYCNGIEVVGLSIFNFHLSPAEYFQSQHLLESNLD